MSKTELINAFAELPPEERSEVLGLFWALENNLYDGPTPEEAALLDAEYEAYKRDGDPGIPWEEALAKLRKRA